VSFFKYKLLQIQFFVFLSLFSFFSYGHIYKRARVSYPYILYRIFDNSVNNFHGQLERTKLRRKVL